VFTLLIALAPAACTRSPGPASPEYEQAHQRFSKLYAQKLDQAFLDPAMDEIEAQLQRVPPDSMDAQSAKELLQRIREGRERAEAAQQETEEAIAAARRIDDFQPDPATPPTLAGEPPPPPSAGPPDAGAAPGPGAGPVAGTSASELPYGYERCFRRGEPVNVDGKGSRDTWELDNRLACRQSYPSFVEQIVLIEDGRVLTVLPKSAIRVTYVGPDGGPPSGR
jgi:hypothetical protein